MAFQSQTYGKLNIRNIPEKITEYIRRMEGYDAPFQITVGTDSQNFSDTKMVSVIAVTCEGHGGIFFYEIVILFKYLGTVTYRFVLLITSALILHHSYCFHKINYTKILSINKKQLPRVYKRERVIF